METWTHLINWQEETVNKLDKIATRVSEPGMERFNKPGWINLVWTADWARRIHLDIVDARDTKGLWMMHFCMFPHLTNSGPIYGLDAIAGKNKLTGFFHDMSPTVDANCNMISVFGDVLENYTWKKERELPDWAKAIFSPSILAVGNINTEDELKSLLEISSNNFDEYISTIRDYDDTCDSISGRNAQNRYGHYQKLNPHTPKTMAALGLNPDDVTAFVQECLFPDIQ